MAQHVDLKTGTPRPDGQWQEMVPLDFGQQFWCFLFVFTGVLYVFDRVLYDFICV